MTFDRPTLYRLAADAGISVTDEILDALTAEGGAVVAFSVSGGKDSSVSAHATARFLDAIGHPQEDRVAVHSDLGEIEWTESHEICARLADLLRVPLKVVRHGRHTMISRWEERFVRGKARYANLEIFNLIGPWSSASLRFCTAEMKQQVISPALKKLYPGRRIISIIGVRREESANRASTPVSKAEPRWDDKRRGTTLFSWNPIVDMTVVEVFAYHTRHGIPLHPAYMVYGCSRVSCMFCVLQKKDDQKAVSAYPPAAPIYRHLVGMEAASTFSFQPDRWLGDVSPHLLTPELVQALARGVQLGAERRALEDALPKGLRYVKGWPPRAPTMEEAEQIVRAREIILGHHDLPVTYPTPAAVIGRFEQLIEEKSPE